MIKKNYMKIINTIIFIVCFLISSNSEAFNSKAEWQAWKQTNSISICVDQGLDRILFDKTQWCNTALPDYMDSNTTIASGKEFISGLVCSVSGNLESQIVGTISALSGVGLIADILEVVYLCTDSYALAPHEIVNAISKSHNRFTEYDIPYIFHCDPSYDPSNPSTPIQLCGPGAAATDSCHRYGATIGYQPPSSTYCSDPKLDAATKEAMKPYVRQISLKINNPFYNDWELTFNANSGKQMIENPLLPAPLYLRAYYNMSETSGKIRLCVSTFNAFGLILGVADVVLGCTNIAPIQDTTFDCDNMYSDTRFSSMCALQGRCRYLGQSRNDLYDLAKYGLQGSSNVGFEKIEGPNGLYVEKFLQSDMHPTSVVVGCIQDTLVQYVNSPISTLGLFQNQMRDIVLAALTLYCCMVAIKILMRASQPISRGDFAMYCLKFAIVFAFAASDGWYKPLSSNDPKSGLAQSIITMPNTAANWFLAAVNINDPTNYCYLQYNNDGQNILSEREIPTLSSGVPTNGYNVIKMSVWDLVDCKLANYISFGACDFSMMGMMSAWLIGALLCAFPLGVPLAVIMLCYSFVTIRAVFHIVQIFILSAFVVTILIVLSPIFMLFWLFDYTKSIFDHWLKFIISYTCYPALTFAFLALMLATFDSVFFGFYTPLHSSDDLLNMCVTNNIQSIFCVVYKRLYETSSATSAINLCELPFGGIISAFVDSISIPFIGKIYYTNPTVLEMLWLPMVQIMLLTLIFSILMENLIEAIAALFQIPSLLEQANAGSFIGRTVQLVSNPKEFIKGKD